LRDSLGILVDPPGWSLRAAMERVAAEEHGVVIVLRWDESPADLIEAAQALGRPRPRRNSGPVLRTYGIGAQILQDLGVRRMRVLSAPKQMHGLSAFGLEVTSYVDFKSANLRAVKRGKA
jgi:3,4-dihydroxy 2-butanone 4-phosphate synthase/GTP cyclohydrolase II